MPQSAPNGRGGSGSVSYRGLEAEEDAKAQLSDDGVYSRQDPVERVDAGHALRYRLEQAKMKATEKKRPKASDLPPADPYM